MAHDGGMRELQIPKALDVIEQKLAQLSEASLQLSERLELVTRPRLEADNHKELSGPSSGNPSVVAPLTERLWELFARVEALVSAISDLTDRLEI